jgi:DNA-binding HxlR family transcriptional regulator
MTQDSYQQFCPVAMAAEILCRRWTLLLLRELLLGSVRFNTLRRGLPRMSSALLVSRLRELEAAGIVVRIPIASANDTCEYRLTAAGRELRPIVESVGVWGQRWVAAETTLRHLDADLLMWDVRRRIDATPMPDRRSTVQFILTDRPVKKRNYWLIVEKGQEVDLCTLDPGYEVDLYVSADLRTLTEIWLGYTSIAHALRASRLSLTGHHQLASTFDTWFALSPLAKAKKQVGRPWETSGKISLAHGQPAR